jgi:hypothetical protein
MVHQLILEFVSVQGSRQVFVEMVSHIRRTDQEILISSASIVDERINGRKVSIMCNAAL